MDPLSVISAVSAIASLAGAGAKLSLFLFEVSSQIGSAADEMRELGSEISLFCAVLKQLQRVLGDAKRRRSSVTAIDTTQQIIERCNLIFRNIENTVKGLHIDTSKVGGSDASNLDFKARIRWTLRKNKVQTHRATLESCKITLTLMVSTLAFADVLSGRRYSSEATEIEDAEEEAILQSLSSAQLHANRRLASVEIEDDQDLDERDHSSPPHYDAVATRGPSSGSVMFPDPEWGLRRGAIMQDKDVNLRSTDIIQPLEKASTWLKRLNIDDILMPDASRRVSIVSVESATKHRQVEHLLFKWTDQGAHWTSLQHQDGATQPSGPSTTRENNFTRDVIGFLTHIESTPISPGTNPALEPKTGILDVDVDTTIQGVP